MKNSQQANIQADVLNFALFELVRQHRESFQPLWTVDSWAKFLIWLSLSCGMSGEKESLELFAQSLGNSLTLKMRRIFFERTLDSPEIQMMADPAEMNVLVMPRGDSSLTLDQVEQALEQVGLLERVQSDQSIWQELDALVAVPWQSI